MRELIGKNNITFAVGPFLSNSDGMSPVTDLAVSSCEIAAIQKHGAVAGVGIAANSWAAVSSMGGHYNLTLTNSQCDTLGPVRISIAKSGTILPFFEDVLLVNSEYFNAKYGSFPFATHAQVSSLDVRVQALPNSATLHAEILTLPTSEGLTNRIATLPNSATLRAHILTLPTSATQAGQFSTLPTSAMVAILPTSEATAAQFLLLPNSQALSVGMSSLGIQITSLDARVSSISAGDLTAAAIWDYGSRTLTSAGAGGATQSEVQSACAAVVADYNLHTLMSSADITARFATLPSSEAVRAWVITLPTSQGLRSEIAALPNSQTLNAQVLTLANQVSSLDVRVGSLDSRAAAFPTSEALNAHMITLPTSAMVRGEIATLPTSSTLHSMVGSLHNLSLSDVTSGIFGYEQDSGHTFLQAQREKFSFLLGVASGGGTNTLVFRDKGDLKNRVSMTVDSAGNRSAVTLDGD